MKKTLSALLGLGLGLSLGINAYSQSPQGTQSSQSEIIPELVKTQAAGYLKRVPYCLGVPIIKKVGEKIEDRTGLQNVKDGIIDKITLYKIENDCFWINVPNYIVYTQIGLKGGNLQRKV